MSDLIERHAVIEAIERDAYRHTYLDQILDIIKSIPSAQPDKTYEQGWKDGCEALRKEKWEDGRDRLD